jgi:hypothetical protein
LVSRIIRQRACAPVDILCRRDRAVVTTSGRAGIRPVARRGDDRFQPEAFIQLADQNQAGV